MDMLKKLNDLVENLNSEFKAIDKHIFHPSYDEAWIDSFKNLAAHYMSEKQGQAAADKIKQRAWQILKPIVKLEFTYDNGENIEYAYPLVISEGEIICLCVEDQGTTLFIDTFEFESFSIEERLDLCKVVKQNIKPELKYTTHVRYEVDSDHFTDFVNQIYGGNFDFVADSEADNYSSYTFSAPNANKDFNGSYEEKIRKGEFSNVPIPALFNVLFKDGHIPQGDYLIKVFW